MYIYIFVNLYQLLKANFIQKKKTKFNIDAILYTMVVREIKTTLLMATLDLTIIKKNKISAKFLLYRHLFPIY